MVMPMALSLKQIFTSDQNWWKFHEKHKDKLRIGILIAVTAMLSCRNIVRGYKTYECENKTCNHVKLIPHTCKSRACSTCGKKLTEAWIAKQQDTLPKTNWQHITFTMPEYLWPLFWHNRHLLNLIPKIAADIIKKTGAKVGALPAIFLAIHTFGRDMKRNVYIHLSATTGGLSDDKLSWLPIFYQGGALMKQWRHEIITLFREMLAKGKLKLPKNIDSKTFKQKLSTLYEIHWQVKCGKVEVDCKRTLAYLARYIKRPPFAKSKLLHYDGKTVGFSFLDRTSGLIKKKTFDVESFIARYIRHIPDPGFRPALTHEVSNLTSPTTNGANFLGFCSNHHF